MGAFILIFLVGSVAYIGWFLGRVHEAEVEVREEQYAEAAYSWAAQHGRLPEPTIIEHWVDNETGEVLGTRQL